nr:hypothetical protein [uncultured Campylobacter sp.]
MGLILNKNQSRYAQAKRLSARSCRVAGKIWLINFAYTGDIAFWRDKFVSFEGDFTRANG